MTRAPAVACSFVVTVQVLKHGALANDHSYIISDTLISRLHCSSLHSMGTWRPTFAAVRGNCDTWLLLFGRCGLLGLADAGRPEPVEQVWTAVNLGPVPAWSFHELSLAAKAQIAGRTHFNAMVFMAYQHSSTHATKLP